MTIDTDALPPDPVDPEQKARYLDLARQLRRLGHVEGSDDFAAPIMTEMRAIETASGMTFDDFTAETDDYPEPQRRRLLKVGERIRVIEQRLILLGGDEWHAPIAAWFKSHADAGTDETAGHPVGEIETLCRDYWRLIKEADNITTEVFWCPGEFEWNRTTATVRFIENLLREVIPTRASN